MTNETTASQPKSIGGDAQFIALLTDVETSQRWTKQMSEASAKLIAYLDSRAPAAQASATIQAAPDKCHWCPECGSDKSAPTGYDNGNYCSDCGQNWFPDIDYTDAIRHNLAVFKRRTLAATVQEPVMVPEPVELVGIEQQLKGGAGFWHSCSGCHDTEDGHPTGPYAYSNAMQCALGSGCAECGGLGACWDHNDYSEAAGDFLIAAPMVADPAGVALATLKRYPDSAGPGRGEMFRVVDVEALFAATVKAVPSEEPSGAPAELLWVEVNLAAVTANKAFGQWMPQRWLEEFVKAYNFEVRATKGLGAAPLADKTGGGE